MSNVPKISVVLATKQELCPMHKTDESIFSILLGYLKEQTFDDFELIVVDHFFEERKHSFDHLKLPFDWKYIPPKPSPWHDLEAPTICSDRNSGVILSRGEIIIVLDDCTFPVHAEAFEQIWNFWNEKSILLRPVMDVHRNDFIPMRIVEDNLNNWIKEQETKCNLLEVSGQRGGVFIFPAYVYEKINGFDERFDGDFGCEDLDFNNRVDAFGTKRFVLKEGQCRFLRMSHTHEIQRYYGYICNEAYAQWSYRRIWEHREHKAGVKFLDSSDLEGIESMCSLKTCPKFNGCDKEERPPGLEYYEKFQPVFNLAEKRKKMTERYGNVNGVMEPW